MRICKLLILFLLLFDWSGKIEAQQSAFGWNDSIFVRCQGQTFHTGELSWHPREFPVALHGWYTTGGISLFDGESIVPITVGDFLVNDTTTMLIFHSSHGTTDFRDTLRITVVPRPRIEMEQTAWVLCYGDEFPLSVTFQENADAIVWTTTTGESFPNNTTITITEPHIFRVLATNRACFGEFAYSIDNIRIDTVMPDTTSMSFRINSRTLCPGCRDTLSNLLQLFNADTLKITSSSWTRSGIYIGELFWDSEIRSPISSNMSETLVGSITGYLYRSAINACGSRRDTLIDEPVTIIISSVDCDFRARWWVPDRSTAYFPMLRDMVCETHIIQVVNPQPDIFTVQNPETDIVIQSAQGFDIPFRRVTSSGNHRIYEFDYVPKDNDTITITVRYRNECTGGDSISPTLTLFFAPTPNVGLVQTYCRTDSFDLRFILNRPVVFMDSVNLYDDNTDFTDSFRLLHPPRADLITFRFNDTIHSWNDRSCDYFRAVVHYRINNDYCDNLERTDTIDISPERSRECYPVVFIESIECKGDTNFIVISERRRPNAFIYSITWVDLPPDVQPIYLDTLFSYPIAEFRQRFITYTDDPIRLQIVYRQHGVYDTIIHYTLQQRIPGMLGIPGNCLPTMTPVTINTLCRGQETQIQIQLRNRTGRIKDVEWITPEGRNTVILNSIDSTPVVVLPNPVHRIYHYTARFQRTSLLTARITYWYGDSIGEEILTRSLNIDDCIAEIWQEAHNKIYCDGEIARFEIRPNANSLSEIVGVRWHPMPEPSSPMMFDSTSAETGVWHFHKNVLRDTRLFVGVVERDYWGDEFDYTLSDTISVRPTPRIWRQDTIDVCGNEIIDLNVMAGGVRRYWHCDFVSGTPHWGAYPFDNPLATAQLFGDDEYGQFRIRANVRYPCAFMETDIIYDSFYLRRNRELGLEIRLLRANGEELLPTDNVCVNDTLYLEALSDIWFSRVTWLRINHDGSYDMIFRDSRIGDTLRTVVTAGTAYYRAIKTTACDPVERLISINIIPAPDLTLPDVPSVCLFDTIILKFPDDNPIEGLPRWYVHDTVYAVNDLRLQIRDATHITIRARGKAYPHCYGKSMITVTPKSLPYVSVTATEGDPGDTVSCFARGIEFKLFATGDPNLEFAWFSQEDSLPYITQRIYVAPTDTNTIFRVRGTDQYGCRNYARYHIIIFEPLTFPEDTACERGIFEFEAERIPYVTYTWRTIYGRSMDSHILTINNVELGDTVFQLFRNLGEGCRDTSRLDVKVQPSARLAIIRDDSRPNYCVGDAITISVMPEYGFYKWWECPQGKIIPHHYLVFPSIDTTDAGTFLLSGRIEIGTRQCTTTYELNIVVEPVPIIDFSPYEFVCVGLGLTMNMGYIRDVGYRLNALYYWWGSGDTTPTLRIEEGGRYIITITDTITGCPTTAYVDIEGRPTPKFSLPNQMAICFERVRGVEYIKVGIVPEDVKQKYIDDVDVEVESFFFWEMMIDNRPPVLHPNSIQIFEPGLYTLTAELNECQWSDSIRITERFCDRFVMPTAFRPSSQIEVGGVFVNSVFRPTRILPEDMVVFEMFIYDRWGTRVFRTTDQNVGWDGTYMNNGRDHVQPGVFVWVIRAHETYFGTDLSNHGTVTLIK